MTWQKCKAPKLSKEAQAWDTRFGSPSIRPTRAKQAPAAYVIPKCSECPDAELFEDIVNGNMVCRHCGLCEQLLIPEDVYWADVDWHAALSYRSHSISLHATC